MTEAFTPAEIDAIKHRVVFVPCRSQDDLQRWIATYLDIEVPDTLVDPKSTCSPMSYLWEVYYHALNGEDPDYSRVLAYASRDSYKSLSTSILEVLMLVHLDRSCGHMAAIEKQARNAQGYVQGFLNKPWFRRFVVGNNARTKEFCRYEHRVTGTNLSEKEFAALDPLQQGEYDEHRSKIDIVICNMAGANGLHVPFFCVDELDIANPEAYEESKMIPTPVGDKSPITVLTSTRKFSFGIVQDEIDKAPKTGLKIHHWNILDVAKQCEPSRHKPDEPKVLMAVDDENLHAITKAAYDRLESGSQERYEVEEVFAGCSTCPIYAACRGNLAKINRPQKYPKATLLVKPISHLINQFKAVDPIVAQAQLLCRKPEQKGLIYPFLDPDIHKLTPAEIAEMVTGEEHPETMTKDQLVDLFRSRNAEFIGGMDFGFTHNWAFPIAAVDNGRCFVLEALSAPGLLTSQQIQMAEARVPQYQPKVYADPENPQAVKEWREAGWDMRKWTKGKGSVLAGIELMRWMQRPLIGEPLVYFVSGDEGVDKLFLDLQRYRWCLDAAGKPTDVPDEANDDLCDAMRYLVMNRFQKVRTTVRQEAVEIERAQLRGRDPEQKNVDAVRRQQIMNHVLEASDDGTPAAMNQGMIKKGRLRFSIG